MVSNYTFYIAAIHRTLTASPIFPNFVYFSKWFAAWKLISRNSLSKQRKDFFYNFGCDVLAIFSVCSFHSCTYVRLFSNNFEFVFTRFIFYNSFCSWNNNISAPSLRQDIHIPKYTGYLYIIPTTNLIYILKAPAQNDT